MIYFPIASFQSIQLSPQFGERAIIGMKLLTTLKTNKAAQYAFNLLFGYLFAGIFPNSHKALPK
jgi:hypothetical protein